MSALPEYDESAPGPWLHSNVARLNNLHAAAPSEVMVTDEMSEAGQDAWYASLQDDGPSGATYETVYRAMAAVAPVAPTWDEIGALEAKNQEWHATWSSTEMQRQQAVARVAELEAEIAALRQAHAAFINPTPADLPPRARRPDGTLAPQQTPFPVLKQARDRRRVGG